MVQETDIKEGMSEDWMITRIYTGKNVYEVEAARWYANQNPSEYRSLHLTLGNGQSTITIYANGQEAEELLKEFWQLLESRGKDFEYNKKLPGLWQPEGI